MNYFLTTPLTITDHPADAQHKGGQRRGYRFIVLHATGGTNSVNWLSTTSPLSNPVSIHRLIDKTGKIYKIVSDEEIAWHAGPARVGPLPARNAQGVLIESLNNWSLGIELENDNSGHDPYPLVQVVAAAMQTAEWFSLYGYLAIVAHSWVDTRKTDPKNFPWDEFYKALDSQIVRARR